MKKLHPEEFYFSFWKVIKLQTLAQAYSMLSSYLELEINFLEATHKKDRERTVFQFFGKAVAVLRGDHLADFNCNRPRIVIR